MLAYNSAGSEPGPIRPVGDAPGMGAPAVHQTNGDGWEGLGEGAAGMPILFSSWGRNLAKISSFFQGGVVCYKNGKGVVMRRIFITVSLVLILIAWLNPASSGPVRHPGGSGRDGHAGSSRSPWGRVGGSWARELPILPCHPPVTPEAHCGSPRVLSEGVRGQAVTGPGYLK